jgi:hypothetical protein
MIACSDATVLSSPVCVSIRQHTSAYVSIRQHTLAYASILQSAYVSSAAMQRRERIFFIWSSPACVLNAESVLEATELAPPARETASDMLRPPNSELSAADAPIHFDFLASWVLRGRCGRVCRYTRHQSKPPAKEDIRIRSAYVLSACVNIRPAYVQSCVQHASACLKIRQHT